MKIVLTIIIFILTFTSCNYSKKILNVKKEKTSLNILTKDSIIIKDKNTVKGLDSIFSIFRVSPGSVGIFIELGFNDKNKLNRLYNKIGETLLNLAIDNKFDDKNLKLVDSSGYQKLYSNSDITRELSNYINKNFQIYCTNGMSESSVKDITFHTSDCQTKLCVIAYQSY